MIEKPGDFFVKPVEGQSDLFAFRYGFNLEGKALEDGPAPVVREDDSGDLIIEGYAAVFEGTDRQDENFIPGSFERGIKSFLSGNNSLCYHHKHDHVIGEVLDLREEEGKGLFMRARVDNQPESSPLRWIYNAVKKGSMKGLSVGGFFRRKLTEAGQRIADMDFTEVSVTGVPVHPGTSFGVVAGKALESDEQDPAPGVDEIIVDFDSIDKSIEALGSVFANIGELHKNPDTTPENTE